MSASEAPAGSKLSDLPEASNLKTVGHVDMQSPQLIQFSVSTATFFIGCSPEVGDIGNVASLRISLEDVNTE